MRKLLASAVALGPLLLATGAGAETVISNKVTAPVATATANSGAPDDVKISGNGSVVVTSGTAVTLNSNNKVTNQGVLNLSSSADNSVGVKVTGGVTGTFLNSGTISVTDDYTPTDADKDGDDDGAFATGTGRHGFWLTGVSPFTGSITFDSQSLVEVEGNQSYAIRLDSGVVGNVSVAGTTKATGTDTYGFRSTGAITGALSFKGSVTATGENARAISIENTVTGRVTVGSNVTATGYRNTSPTTDQQSKLDSDDKLIGGSAFTVAGDLQKGLLIDAVPADEDKNNSDEDGDGVTDSDQSNGTITVYGSAPALRIGSSSKAVTLGAVAAATNYNYGLVLKGTVNASGVLDGVSATGVKIGSGAYDTVVQNGMRISGSINAAAKNGDVTGLQVGMANDIGSTAKTQASTILLDGGVVSASTVSGIVSGVETKRTVTAILVGENAQVSTVRNSRGSIQASISGEDGAVYGLRDLSGSVTTIENTGSWLARFIPTDDSDDKDDSNTDPSDEVIKGVAVAIDVSANTSGVTLTQKGVVDGDDGADGKADPDDDGDGVDDNDEPILIGAVRLGSGNDVLNFENGTVTGDLAFGGGSDTLNITGGAVVAGRICQTLSNAGVCAQNTSPLAINLANGTLQLENTKAVNASSLTVGAKGELIVLIDPKAATSGLVVSGAASFANGAKIGIRLSDLVVSGGQTFNVVDAGSLTVANLSTLADLTENVPYLYVTNLAQQGNRLVIQVGRRSAQSANMSIVEAAAYDAIYAELAKDTAIRDAFLAQTTRKGFFNLYEQFLPDHSGAPLISLASGVDAVSRALSDQRPPAQGGEVTGWLQEINFYADKKKDDSYGFRSDGFGVAGGVERGVGFGAFGLSLAFTSSDMKDPEAENKENTSADLFELGLYWRSSGEGLRSWARVAAGYAKFTSTRSVIGAGLNRSYESKWDGYSAAAGAGLSYEARFAGRWFLRPEASVEYFYLNESAHEESGGTDSLALGERTGSLLSGKALLTVGGRFGEQGWLRPELHLGWRQNFTADAGDTIARFRYAGSSPFVLTSEGLDQGGPIIGFRLMAGGDMGYIALEGDAELLDIYSRYSILLRAGYRF